MLKRLKETAERGRICLLLVMQYAYPDFPRTQPSPSISVLDCARKFGVEALDTWSRLVELKASDPVRFDSLFKFYWGVASHMSPAGNRLVAAEITSRLQSGN